MYEELDDNFNVVHRAWPAHTPGFPERVPSIKDYFTTRKTARKIDLRMSTELIVRYHDEYVDMVRNCVAKILLKLDKE